MTIQTSIERSGNLLFRWRSYVPLSLLAVMLIAFEGFHYPFASHAWDTAWDMFCLTVSLFGLAVRVGTVGFVPKNTSGRNVKGQVADTLNTTGMYSMLRHPLYFGNFWMWMGVALFPRVWWCAAIVALSFALIYERIMAAEEAFLRSKYGSTFDAWAARTPAFWPNISLWKRPASTFSLKTVIKRENSSFFGMVCAFYIIEELGEFVVNGGFHLDVLWTVIFVASVIAYLAFKWLKGRKLLREEGR